MTRLSIPELMQELHEVEVKRAMRTRFEHQVAGAALLVGLCVIVGWVVWAWVNWLLSVAS